TQFFVSTAQVKAELVLVGCDAAAMLEDSDISRMYHYAAFPKDFLWGVTSSAYQIEGGWEADGKGASIWDTFTHQKPSSIPENATGDVACNSYSGVQQDLDLIKTLGVKSYRFSISWPRLFPNGTTAEPVNPKGLDYYNALIDGLLSLNVAPVVTLYHWDLPQALQDDGGWKNENIIKLFNGYAEFCFKTFGDRVRFWITFNDPFTVAWKGYGSGEMPPNLKADPGTAPYHVGRILLKAHATVYHTYQTYRPTQKGLVSIALNGDWYEPLDVNVPRDLEAADRAMQFRLGWFAHPIFKNGDYPEAMKFQVAAKSDLQRLKESRLPALTEDEKAMIRGTADVFCLNHHTTKIAKSSTQQLTPHSYQYDWDIMEQELTHFPQTGLKGQRAVSWGLRRVLNWIKLEYGDPEVYVTDNGVATERKVSDDDSARVFFLKTYIDEALKAQSLDGVRLRGYLGAPLMDGFEWLQGYTVGSGLIHVDFTNSTLPRTHKYSSQLYQGIVKKNGFPPGEDETKCSPSSQPLLTSLLTMVDRWSMVNPGALRWR
uniref:Lactase n=1 Tax=Neogobius melanostomus TaxID=47308 RepID=A0A8C6UNH4_9GOBI